MDCERELTFHQSDLMIVSRSSQFASPIHLFSNRRDRTVSLLLSRTESPHQLDKSTHGRLIELLGRGNLSPERNRLFPPIGHSPSLSPASRESNPAAPRRTICSSSRVVVSLPLVLIGEERRESCPAGCAISSEAHPSLSPQSLSRLLLP